MDVYPIPITDETVQDPVMRRSALALLRELWDSQPRRENTLSGDELIRVADARHAFRRHDLVLMRTLIDGLNSPEAINLHGVLQEALGQHENARRLYQQALANDRGLFAAEINLRRSYELWEFGESQIPYAL